MTPRRKARLQLYSFIFLFVTIVMYYLVAFNSKDRNSASERNSRLEMLQTQTVLENRRFSFDPNSPYSFSIRGGIEALGVKDFQEKSEIAPRGIDNNFKRNITLKHDILYKEIPQSRRDIDHQNDVDFKPVNKFTKFPTGQDKNIFGENAKFRNLSKSVIKPYLKRKQSTSASLSGGMLSLINDSNLDINFYTNIEPLIPHILHQTWDTYEVPDLFIPWIKSVVAKHPNWTYLFWTQDDVQCYFKYRFPDFVDLYNSYSATIFKTDVMRYFLLYDIGGFYLDLDIECLKPLDIWSHYARCSLSHETYEHVFLIRDRKDVTPSVMTTVLACKQHHPYYKLLQDNLSRYYDLYKADVLRATGPYFMQEMLNVYMNTTNQTDTANQITILNPAYWLPTFDPILKNKIDHRCTNRYKNLPPYARDLCRTQMLDKFRNEPSDMAYLNHHWVHTNLKPAAFKHTNLIDIRTVLPDLIKVTDYLNLTC